MISNLNSPVLTGCPDYPLVLVCVSSSWLPTNIGAIKLHVGLNYADYLADFVIITKGKNYDLTVGRILNFLNGNTVTIDKAYNDYAWYKKLTDTDIFFVTRLWVMRNITLLNAKMYKKNLRTI